MRRGSVAAAGLVAVLALGCSGCIQLPVGPPIPIPGGGPKPSQPIPSGLADEPTPAQSGFSEADLPKMSSQFRRHFTDPLYLDQGEEFSPFGSDEGSDTLAYWADRRSDLDRCTTVRWMFEQDDEAGALAHPANNGPDVDGFILGMGFGLILLTGHIDSEGKQLTLDALHRSYSYYADSRPREFAVMVRDLESFPASDCSS